MSLATCTAAITLPSQEPCVQRHRMRAVLLSRSAGRGGCRGRPQKGHLLLTGASLNRGGAAFTGAGARITTPAVRGVTLRPLPRPLNPPLGQLTRCWRLYALLRAYP